MATPLPEDVLVSSGGFWTRCALAVAKDDAAAALELVREMQACEGKLFLGIVAGAPVPPASLGVLSRHRCHDLLDRGLRISPKPKAAVYAAFKAADAPIEAFDEGDALAVANYGLSENGAFCFAQEAA